MGQRYYFHVVAGGRVNVDRVGELFANQTQAMAYGQRVVNEIAPDFATSDVLVWIQDDDAVTVARFQAEAGASPATNIVELGLMTLIYRMERAHIDVTLTNLQSMMGMSETEIGGIADVFAQLRTSGFRLLNT